MTTMDQGERLADAEDMAYALFREHGLGEWTFAVDNAVNRLGVCRAALRTISLSRHHLLSSTTEQIRNTLLHEIAHALVGPHHGHDKVWRAKCLEIGGDGQRGAEGEGLNMPQGKWVGTCPTCKEKWHRHRLTAAARRGHCPSCSEFSFSDKTRIVWRRA